MKEIHKIFAAVVTILVVGVWAMESEAQGHGRDGISIGWSHDLPHPSVFLPPPPPLPSLVFSEEHRENHRREYRPHHRNFEVCWEEVVRVERRHGRYRNETRTVCRDRGWRGHHRDDWRDEHHGRRRW